MLLSDNIALLEGCEALSEGDSNNRCPCPKHNMEEHKLWIEDFNRYNNIHCQNCISIRNMKVDILDHYCYDCDTCLNCCLHDRPCLCMHYLM